MRMEPTERARADDVDRAHAVEGARILHDAVSPEHQATRLKRGYTLSDLPRQANL